MPSMLKVTVPDIGEFSDVPVIEILVAAGDTVEVEQSLVTLESDKATMGVPAPAPGRVTEISIKLGDTVSEGSQLLTLELGDDAQASPQASAPQPARSATDPAPSGTTDSAPSKVDKTAEVLVIGAGPGGYTAAFRAADLGKQVVLVERYPALGGVCLNVGCIPSKALLHTAEVINATQAMASHGLDFGTPKVDLPKLAGWKDKVVGQLTKGLAGLARQRKVEVVQGSARFESPNVVRVNSNEGELRIGFEQAIIAAGSQAAEIPSFPNDDPRMMDSTDALALEEIPQRLLVVGGGIIGLEMATVYHALGSKVTVVELMDGLIPGCDPEIVRPLHKHIAKQYENVFLKTEVKSIEATVAGLEVRFEGPKAPASDTFDRVLVAVGRRPNGHVIEAMNAGVIVDEDGFIPVDKQQRTNVAHIFAIGDIVGQPMLAHKATHEGKVAAEVAAGEKASFDALTIPSVAYTDPEVAWTGFSEAELKGRGIAYEKATFPWAASGRSLGMGRNEGLTKVIFEHNGGRLLGAAVVGPHAGDLIAEATLALEMGADAADLSLTIHPHPTLSETLNFAAEMVEGTITDLYLPKKKKSTSR
ncbi:MAG: dihydrolipoyl dehydrogenase [Gammaproteobacteria bacterium]